METIECYFLPVGHTHGQIDQMFSRLSVFLNRRWQAKTLPELQWCLYQSYNNPAKSRRVSRNPRKPPNAQRERIPVTSSVIDSVVDVAHWLEPMNPNINGTFTRGAVPLRGVHAFQFKRSTHGDVLLSSKEWASSPAWQVLYRLLLLVYFFFFIERKNHDQERGLATQPASVRGPSPYPGERTRNHSEETSRFYGRR